MRKVDIVDQQLLWLTVFCCRSGLGCCYCCRTFFRKFYYIFCQSFTNLLKLQIMIILRNFHKTSQILSVILHAGLCLRAMQSFYYPPLYKKKGANSTIMSLTRVAIFRCNIWILNVFIVSHIVPDIWC